MQYTTLGRTGLVVSRLSLGTMTISMDQKEADNTISRALDAGINLFDSADIYHRGQSETLLGKALSQRRQEVIISTKGGLRMGAPITNVGLSYRYIIAAVEASIKRLGTDYIDLYQIHIPDPLTPLEETVRALDDLVRRGLVRYVGFSNQPAWRAALMVGIQERYNYAPFAAAQMYYSLLGRDLEHEVVPFVQSKGIGILVWSPLARGFLGGKYSRETPAPPEVADNRFQIPPVDLEKCYDVVDLLKQIAKDREASLAQVAIAWILSKPFISSVILGASKISHLEDNLAAAELKLSPQEVERLDALTAPQPLYPGWMEWIGWDTKVKESLAMETIDFLQK